MSRSIKLTFLALILAQTGHSIEEYSTHLYDVLAPARFVSSLVSDDLGLGFAIVNASLIAFGLWCFFGPVRHGSRYAVSLAWGWVVLETLNGCAHLGWAAIERAYRPGVASAPVLVAIAVTLGWQLAHASAATNAKS